VKIIFRPPAPVRVYHRAAEFFVHRDQLLARPRAANKLDAVVAIGHD
jgi:hypothetical protein